MITPCISVCKIDETINICTVCKRTSEQIRDWDEYTVEEQAQIMKNLGYYRRESREEKLRRYDRG